jgi:biopolymer transport protein ExbB
LASGDRLGVLNAATRETLLTALSVAAAMWSLHAENGGVEHARQLAVQMAMDQLAQMSRLLRFHAAVVQAALMLRRLGTVIGMVSAFGELSHSGGAADPAALANGIGRRCPR